MGKFEKKKTRKKKKAWKGFVIALALAMILSALALFVVPQVLYRLSGEAEEMPVDQIEDTVTVTETVAVAEVVAVPTVSGVTYPVELEGGRLILENLFEFEGINPDCNYEPGESIASVTLRNTSECYLTEVKLTLLLADGGMIEYLLTDLPAGKTAMAFALDNYQLREDTVCVEAFCSAVWDEDFSGIPDGVTVSAEGTTVTITNNTAQDIPALTVYCRDPFIEEYFGGKAYEYTVNNLFANGQATLEALDCIMGQAEVVRIAIHE